jgi:hypothetical protein
LNRFVMAAPTFRGFLDIPSVISGTRKRLSIGPEERGDTGWTPHQALFSSVIAKRHVSGKQEGRLYRQVNSLTLKQCIGDLDLRSGFFSFY